MLFLYYLVYLTLAIAFWLIPIVIVMHTHEKDYKQQTDRVLWFILVLVTPPLGGIVFLLCRPDRKDSPLKRWGVDVKINALGEGAKGK